MNYTKKRCEKHTQKYFSASCFCKNYQWEKQLNLLNLRIWPLLTNLNSDFQIFKFLKKYI